MLNFQDLKDELKDFREDDGAEKLENDKRLDEMAASVETMSLKYIEDIGKMEKLYINEIVKRVKVQTLMRDLSDEVQVS